MICKAIKTDGEQCSLKVVLKGYCLRHFNMNYYSNPLLLSPNYKKQKTREELNKDKEIYNKLFRGK